MDYASVSHTPEPDPWTVRFGRSARLTVTAKALVALNLGGLFGYVIWRNVRNSGLQAQTLTLAQYTARFEGYRDHLITSARASMSFYVLFCALMALGAALLYELLSRGLAALLGRPGFGSILGLVEREPHE